MVEKRHCDKWTFDTVLIHIKALLEEMEKRTADRFAAQEKAVAAALVTAEKAVNAALAAQEKAVSLAEKNAEKWRDSSNEWRSAMNDRESAFVKKGEYASALDQIKEIKECMLGTTGRGQGLQAGWAYLMAFIGAIVGIVGIVLVITR